MLRGNTIFGFKNQTAIMIEIAGRPLWVMIHGRKPNSMKAGAMDHDQHLIYCPQVPQDCLQPECLATGASEHFARPSRHNNAAVSSEQSKHKKSVSQIGQSAEWHLRPVLVWLRCCGVFSFNLF